MRGTILLLFSFLLLACNTTNAPDEGVTADVWFENFQYMGDNLYHVDIRWEVTEHGDTNYNPEDPITFTLGRYQTCSGEESVILEEDPRPIETLTGGFGITVEPRSRQCTRLRFVAEWVDEAGRNKTEERYDL